MGKDDGEPEQHAAPDQEDGDQGRHNVAQQAAAQVAHDLTVVDEEEEHRQRRGHRQHRDHDVCGIKHSLHRSWKDARGFYAIYAALVALAAAIVLIPNAPLGLITTAVQALAGVLLPSASVFLLLLCNDRAVLGPWVNKPWLNAMTSAIVGVLVMLSLILAATTLFPSVDVRLLTVVLAAILVVGLVVTGLLYLRRPASTPIAAVAEADRLTWRMPPLAALPKPAWPTVQTVGMVTLRGYLLVAAILLAVKVVGLALGH